MHNLLAFLTVAIISAESLFSPAKQEPSPTQRATQPVENAQKTEPRVRVVSPPFPVQPLTLPQGENAWALHIVSRGGFIGVGRGELVVKSDGFLSWKGVDGTCSRKLTDAPMQALAKIVAAVDASEDWGGSKVNGTCYDCYVTGLILQRREVRGIERSYTSFWDDSTEADIPENVMKMYDAFMAFRGCRL